VSRIFIDIVFRVIMGGLISSTLLARLVTPVMYKLIPPAA